MRAMVGDIGKGIQHLLRRVKIREALGEIDRAAGIADARHAADNGIGKCSYAIT